MFAPRKIYIALIVSAILIAAAWALPAIFQNLRPKQTGEVVQPSPAETPVSIPQPTYQMTLATGTQRYFISSPEYPSFTEAVIDPFDPAIGASQTVRVKVRDFAPIEKVAATLYTDNSSKTYELKLVEGTNLDGAWEGSWVINDTYNVKYILAITAKSRSGSSKVDLTFR